MPRVVHFELFAADPVRAVCFYQTAFGWEAQRWGEGLHWLVTTGPDDQPGINGSIAPRPEGPTACITTIDVPSLDVYIERVLSAGGSVAAPKMPVPGVGWLAYCRDTEGNTFGMMQADSKAR